ncbi:MAG: Y-family DNA polymerase [Planctomycetia bacterium]|nr:Y-family DNA polymerase [Planctomycetia bacterium]
MFAMVDCNSFFASCEKVFVPSLWNRPVIVLSNNDGCVVARSPEAKALGIPMGVPFFQMRALCQRNRVACFSANFELYADMSRRVMCCLRDFAPQMEIYSIDEAFLDVSEVPNAQTETFQREIVTRVYRWTGIPVSLGLGPTKTLAKLANHLAKEKRCGWFSLVDSGDFREYLPQVPIGEVWGVGRRTVKPLQQMGIRTAWDLYLADPIAIRRAFSIVLERTVRELRGERCLELENMPAPKQTIQVSRSFGNKVMGLDALQHPVASFLSHAMEKLRKQKGFTRAVYLFACGIRPDPTGPQPFSAGTTVTLDRAADDTLEVLPPVLEGLKKIYDPEVRYARAGVTLLGISEHSEEDKYRMFQTPEEQAAEAQGAAARRELMKTLDRLHRELGRRSVVFASQGLENQTEWTSRSAWKSPAYTTEWADLPKVR